MEETKMALLVCCWKWMQWKASNLIVIFIGTQISLSFNNPIWQKTKYCHVFRILVLKGNVNIGFGDIPDCTSAVDFFSNALVKTWCNILRYQLVLWLSAASSSAQALFHGRLDVKATSLTDCFIGAERHFDSHWCCRLWSWKLKEHLDRKWLIMPD